jgi:replicative DNA helicase
MSNPLGLVLDRLGAAGCDPRPTSSGHEARCPAHDDRRASLSVGTGDDGRVLVRCHAGCPTDAVVAALGMTMPDLFSDASSPVAVPRPRPVTRIKPAEPVDMFPTVEALVAHVGTWRLPSSMHWVYHDADGLPVGVVFRFDPPGKSKYFNQGRRFPDGRWAMKAMPTPRPLYRLPAVLSSTGPLWVCEGEKAADALVSIGLEATTSPGGAEAAGKADWSPVAGREVVVVPDHDDPGEAYAADVARLARAARAGSVLVVRLVDLWPGLPVKGDAHDWVEAHDAIEPDALRGSLVRAAADAADAAVVGIAITAAGTSESSPPTAVARLVSISAAIESWRKQERLPVVETGFAPLDDAGGGGLPVGGLTVFAGPPGVGKSAFALQATLGALRVDPTLRATWAAGEMTVEGIAQRAVVNWAAGPANRNVSMKGAADRTKAALAVAADLETAVGDRLQLLPAPLPVEDILDVVAATGSKLLVVDFLQLVEVAGATDRRHEVDSVVRALRTVATQQGVAVVLLSNIAKNVGGDARAGVVGKESSEVDFAADILFLGVEDDPGSDARERPVRWRCLKNRNGERLDLETTFNGSRQWFAHEATTPVHADFADFAPAGGKP